MAYGMSSFGGEGGPANESRKLADQEWYAQQAMNGQAQQQHAEDMGREQHERGLQQQEQARRGYDSQSQRQIGQQKMGVLSGLFGQSRRMV